MKLLAEVHAELADLRIGLYRTNGTHRIRVGGMGWAPGQWPDYDKAMKRLLNCQGYGPSEREMLQGMCRA